jgi:hypothetical protein
MREHCRFVFEQPVVAAIELVALGLLSLSKGRHPRRADRPVRCARTIRGAAAIRCPAPTADRPPAQIRPDPSACLCGSDPTVPPRTGRAPARATVPMPASRRLIATAAAAAITLPGRSRSPAAAPRSDLLETATACVAAPSRFETVGVLQTVCEQKAGHMRIDY